LKESKGTYVRTYVPGIKSKCYRISANKHVVCIRVGGVAVSEHSSNEQERFSRAIVEISYPNFGVRTVRYGTVRLDRIRFDRLLF